MIDYGYSKGMAKILTEEENSSLISAKTGEVYLPHSCNEWVIGDKDNVKLLIRDLQELLNKM